MKTTTGSTAVGAILSTATASDAFVLVRSGGVVGILPCVSASGMFSPANQAAAVLLLEQGARALFAPNYYQAYYDASFCHKHGVCNNPLKPQLGPGEVERKGYVEVDMLTSGVDTVVATMATLELLSTFLNGVLWSNDRYSTSTADVALYLAQLRVHLGLYRDTKLARMAVRNFPVMAHWHVAKQLFIKEFEFCFSWLYVPLRRKIHPHSPVYAVGVSLGLIVRTFNIIAVAYEQVRDKFKRLYASPLHSPVAKALEQFFEILLPLVC
jgi:hypothetical protein